MSNHKPTTNKLPAESILKVLADPYRRSILSYLQTKNTRALTLDEIAEHVFLTNDSVASVQETRVMLIHHLLPYLADHRFIDYNEQNQIIQHRVNVFTGFNED